MVIRITAAKKGNAGGKQRVRHVTPARDPQSTFVEKSALALFGKEKLVARWVKDGSGGNAAGAGWARFQNGNGDGELRNAMQEIGRAVQRVNNPDGGVRVFAGHYAAFLEQEAPIRAGLFQFAADGALCIGVGAADKIGRTLPADLQILDFTKILQHPAAGGDGRFLHDIDKRGLGGHGAETSEKSERSRVAAAWPALSRSDVVMSSRVAGVSLSPVQHSCCPRGGRQSECQSRYAVAPSPGHHFLAQPACRKRMLSVP